MITMIPVCFPLNLLARGSEKDEDLMTKKIGFSLPAVFYENEFAKFGRQVDNSQKFKLSM